ncbi:hypothetical protein JAAARDRAFT_192955 [Jaapia argillacea MUCL 33604]|uniref:Uncharacterized protein n=1 Tax=Jaapia argillacea MUCL 33604 TaxID=933084 RepID=A0A067PU80_9AGAM|nr:hypothetical protein JAAARDRAFT_192955 [Jaapia argillacea MUCL 33604]
MAGRKRRAKSPAPINLPLSDDVLSEPAPSSKKRKISAPKTKKATKTKQKPMKETPTTPSSPDNEEATQDILDEILDGPATSTRRSSTRAGDRHPAERLGLKKKTMVDISAEAERKRREKMIQQEEKAAKKVAKELREGEGAKKLAVLEAARVQEDMDEEEHIRGSASRHYRAPTKAKVRPQEDPVVEVVESGSEYTRGESDLDDQGSDSDIEFESDDEETRGRKKRLTATKKKNIRKKQLRASITNDPLAVAPKSNLEKTAPAKSNKARLGGAFDPTWRDNFLAGDTLEEPESDDKHSTLSGLLAQPSSSRHANMASSQPGSDPKLDLLFAPVPPKSNAVQRKPKQVSLKRSPSSDSIEEIGGFKDEDVSIKREAATTSIKGIKKQMVEVIIPDERDEAKPKPPRKPKTPAKPTKTLAFSALPLDIQPVYHSPLLSTLIEFYGGEKDPFDLDQGKDLFKRVTQRTVTSIFPHKHIPIVKSGEPDNGRTYAISRQGMSEWRRSFHTTANKVVKRKINECPRTVLEIKDLVRKALEDDGEAYWAEVDPNDPGASRAWCSSYILETLASHIQATRGSVLPEGSVLPLGALALSIVAVQRAFLMYESGTFVPTDEFSDENIGDLTREYTGVILRRLMDKPSRFQSLIAKAKRYITQVNGHARGKRKAGEGVKIRAVMIQDPSSPIPFEDN